MKIPIKIDAWQGKTTIKVDLSFPVELDHTEIGWIEKTVDHDRIMIFPVTQGEINSIINSGGKAFLVTSYDKYDIDDNGKEIAGKIVPYEREGKLVISLENK